MTRIREAFTRAKAFIPFITCGDPDIDTTKRIIHEMVRNGADIIELGIPFSDPTAEGEVIQSANYRALRNGVTTDKIFGMVRELRKDIDIPFVFMTYANVVFSYGAGKFMSICRDIGIDGLILPDVPYEEKNEFQPLCKSYGVELISMIAPTSDERIAMISREAEGFLYVVSSLGVTGVRERITTDIAGMIASVRRNSDVPCAIGFGISEAEQAREMSRIADGVIVGSAVMKIVARYGSGSAGYVGEYVRAMKDAIL